jgi:putative transposase
MLVLLAGRVQAWQQAMLIVRPDTLLRWHRAGSRLFWRWRSMRRYRQSRVPRDTVILIRQMAAANSLWGDERIRGELRKPASPSASGPSGSTCGRRAHPDRPARCGTLPAQP